MRSVPSALAAGLALTVVAGAVVLSRSPPAVLATNAITAGTEVAITEGNAKACQADESMPAGTKAIRLSLGAFTGPAVTVKAVSGTRVVTSGKHRSGWDGKTVTIPVRAVPAAVSPVTICFSTPTAKAEEVKLLGSSTKPALAARTGRGEVLGGRIRVEYLGDGHSSWLALLPSVARYMGRGRAWNGIWITVLVAALMLAVTTLASRLIVRELDE
jgi:hypothetical protein